MSVQFPDGEIKTIEIRIPDDCYQGQKLKFAGLAPDNRDLVIEFDIIVPQEYVLQKRDLIYVFKTDGITASIGGNFIYHHLDGKDYEFEIPAGIQHGSKMRKAGMGLASLGDLVIVFQVENEDMSRYRDEIERILDK